MNYIRDTRLKWDNGYNMVIEIPKGSRNKYELVDQLFDTIVSVRKMPYRYPFYYGCFTQTLALDKDPLDAILLSKRKFKSLDVVNVQPIAVIKTIDRNEVDDKVICVLKDENIKTEKLLKKVLKFLKIYKGKDSKTTIDNTIYGMDEAIKVIETTHKSYMNKLVQKTLHIN